MHLQQPFERFVNDQEEHLDMHSKRSLKDHPPFQKLHLDIDLDHRDFLEVIV